MSTRSYALSRSQKLRELSGNGRLNEGTYSPRFERRVNEWLEEKRKLEEENQRLEAEELLRKEENQLKWQQRKDKVSEVYQQLISRIKSYFSTPEVVEKQEDELEYLLNQIEDTKLGAELRRLNDTINEFTQEMESSIETSRKKQEDAYWINALDSKNLDGGNYDPLSTNIASDAMTNLEEKHKSKLLYISAGQDTGEVLIYKGKAFLDETNEFSSESNQDKISMTLYSLGSMTSRFRDVLCGEEEEESWVVKFFEGEDTLAIGGIYQPGVSGNRGAYATIIGKGENAEKVINNVTNNTHTEHKKGKYKELFAVKPDEPGILTIYSDESKTDQINQHLEEKGIVIENFAPYASMVLELMNQLKETGYFKGDITIALDDFKITPSKRYQDSKNIFHKRKRRGRTSTDVYVVSSIM
ncbi:MAG: hypothetical protein GOU98_02440 [Candidatus Altiarchaeota archaeon]|nr:hypothetical protein [Candidatus Altiarchaeota archaeon]